MKRLQPVLISLGFIVIVAFLTKPTDRKCSNKVISELIEKTKSGNSTKDTIIAIIIQGNIEKRIGIEDFFLYKKVIYKSKRLTKNGGLEADDLKVATGLLGNVFVEREGLNEVIRVNGL
jgi:hypothetical protein